MQRSEICVVSNRDLVHSVEIQKFFCHSDFYVKSIEVIWDALKLPFLTNFLNWFHVKSERQKIVEFSHCAIHSIFFWMNFKCWLISLFSIFLIVIGCGIFVRCASLYLNFFQIAILFSCNGYSIFEEYRIESHGWFEQWHVSENGREIVNTILPLVKMTRVRPWRPEK